VISCSEVDTKSALGDGPKVFILALATSDITYTPVVEFSLSGCGNTLAGTNFSFLLILHDVADNIKHCASIDHGVSTVETFYVVPKRKRIIVFKLGDLWVFKQFFDNREFFSAFLDYYNKDLYRFEFKSTGARNNALKILERNGFDYDLVEDLMGYVVWLPKSAKYAPILKNSVAFKETANERVFLMKDLVAVEEAVGLARKSMKRSSPFNLAEDRACRIILYLTFVILSDSLSQLHAILKD
jgi:hypothetical protein